jgi:hypothetical protein
VGSRQTLDQEASVLVQAALVVMVAAVVLVMVVVLVAVSHLLLLLRTLYFILHNRFNVLNDASLTRTIHN